MFATMMPTKSRMINDERSSPDLNPDLKIVDMAIFIDESWFYVRVGSRHGD